MLSKINLLWHFIRFMNLCITSYYGLRESLLYAANELEKLGYNIYDYPIKKKFIDAVPIDEFIGFVKDNQIQIILWWCIQVDTEDFERIKNETDAIFVYFNWDEPFNWILSDIINKAKFIDIAFVICKETLNRYANSGAKAYYLLPGFNPKVHFKKENPDYTCDVSFCLTNLYDNKKLYPDQYIQRKKIVQDIYDNQEKYNYTFHIYSPPKFKDMFPKSYQGPIRYDSTNELFNSSRINLCTHVICNKEGYLNERTILIGGSGGLLLIDPVKGLNQTIDPDNDCIVLKKSYIEQIKDILSDYEKYVPLKENIHKKFVNKYTYKHFALFIHEKLTDYKPLEHL